MSDFWQVEELQKLNSRLDEISRILCLLVLTTAANDKTTTPQQLEDLGKELARLRGQHE